LAPSTTVSLSLFALKSRPVTPEDKKIRNEGAERGGTL